MKNILLEDITVGKKNIIISMFIVLLFSVCWTYLREISLILNIISIMIFVYICIQGSIWYDDLNKTYILIQSLTVDRCYTVKSKYMEVIICLVMGELELTLINLIIKSLKFVQYNIMYINFITMITSVIIILIYYSIYYPLYFKLGSKYISFINKIIFMTLALSPSIILKILRKHPNINIVKSLSFVTNYKIILMVLLCSILMFVLSLKISQRIYTKRDLV